MRLVPRFGLALHLVYGLTCLSLLANDEGMFAFVPVAGLVYLAGALGVLGFALLGREPDAEA